MEELDIKELIEVILQKKWIVIFITLLCMILGYLYNSYYTEPLYKSSTTLLLAKTTPETNTTTTPNNMIENQAITQTDVSLNQKLVSTYSELAKSSGVINSVINKLNLNISEEEIRNSISVSEVDNTEILKISVSNNNNILAAVIANELATVFTERIIDLYSIDNIKVVDSAVAAKHPYNINPNKYAALGGTIGFVLSIVLILTTNLIKDAARTQKQVERVLKIPVLATIGKDKNNSNKLATFIDSTSFTSESFKALRTNIKFCKKEGIKSIAITSSVPEEGKSWTSANLAVIFAKNGENVLLIDADMRRGKQHSIFNVPQKDGLSELLKNNDIEILNDYIKETNINNLDLITCGNLTKHSSELLLNNTFERLLEILKEKYDRIIIDTTPCSIVTDGTIVSRLVDTNIIITKYNYTDLDSIYRIKENIQKVNGNVLGLIINQIPNTNKKYMYYSSYYSCKDMMVSGKHRIDKLSGNKINSKV